MLKDKLLVVCSTLLALCAAAQAGIIQIGSNLTFGGTNAPDTYSATTTFGSTPVLVDNRAVEIWQNQVPTSGAAIGMSSTCRSLALARRRETSMAKRPLAR